MAIPKRSFRGKTVHIVRRCTDQRFFLRSCRRVKNVLLYCMFEAARKHGIEIHAWAFLSNHVHVIATDRSGKLSKFLHRFFKFSSECLKRIHEIEGRQNVWDDQEETVQELTDANVIVKKGLEASGAEIPMEEVVISTRGQVLEQHSLA